MDNIKVYLFVIHNYYYHLNHPLLKFTLKSLANPPIPGFVYANVQTAGESLVTIAWQVFLSIIPKSGYKLDLCTIRIVDLYDPGFVVSK